MGRFRFLMEFPIPFIGIRRSHQAESVSGVLWALIFIGRHVFHKRMRLGVIIKIFCPGRRSANLKGIRETKREYAGPFGYPKDILYIIYFCKAMRIAELRAELI